MVIMTSKRLLKQISFVFIILAIAILAKPILALYSPSQRLNLTCNANLTVIKMNSKLFLAIKYYINGNNGIINYQGILDDGEDIYNVSRAAYFKVNRFKKMVNIKTSEITVSPADDTPLDKIENLIPAAYLVKDQNFKFEIYKQSNNSYIFSTGYIPSFHCSVV